jgi:hypothetical protein
MTEEINHDQRLWLARISDDVSHAVEAGLDPHLVLDAVAIGLELDQRAALWGGSPLSVSLARAFSSSVGPDPCLPDSSAAPDFPSASATQPPMAVRDLTALSGAAEGLAYDAEDET